MATITMGLPIVRISPAIDRAMKVIKGLAIAELVIGSIHFIIEIISIGVGANQADLTERISVFGLFVALLLITAGICGYVGSHAAVDINTRRSLVIAFVILNICCTVLAFVLIILDVVEYLAYQLLTYASQMDSVTVNGYICTNSFDTCMQGYFALSILKAVLAFLCFVVFVVTIVASCCSCRACCGASSVTVTQTEVVTGPAPQIYYNPNQQYPPVGYAPQPTGYPQQQMGYFQQQPGVPQQQTDYPQKPAVA